MIRITIVLEENYSSCLGGPNTWDIEEFDRWLVSDLLRDIQKASNLDRTKFQLRKEESILALNPDDEKGDLKWL